MKKVLLLTCIALACLASQSEKLTPKLEPNICTNNPAKQSFVSAAEAIEQHLANELGDAAIAKELTTLLAQDILTWKAATISPEQLNSIIAFAFGNRILPNGNRLPGPVNEELAKLVIELHNKTNAHVYAQWEIGQIISDHIAPEKLTIINPLFDAQANVVYLSTAGVISEIIKHSGNAQKLGKVGVVAFNDHIYRCIKISHDAGVDAYVPEDYVMPNKYDAQSGQPWTRNRLTYLVTDMKARITNQFEKLIA